MRYAKEYNAKNNKYRCQLSNNELCRIKNKYLKVEQNILFLLEELCFIIHTSPRFSPFSSNNPHIRLKNNERTQIRKDINILLKFYLEFYVKEFFVNQPKLDNFFSVYYDYNNWISFARLMNNSQVMSAYTDIKIVEQAKQNWYLPLVKKLLFN